LQISVFEEGWSVSVSTKFSRSPLRSANHLHG